jgi:hypothetical protein
MQLPVLPPTGQVHPPAGAQTIGCGGAASPITVQSESVLHGYCGISQIPQPMVTPPGLHSKSLAQSLLELQLAAPSGGPESGGGHSMFDCSTCQLPPLQIATTLHP